MYLDIIKFLYYKTYFKYLKIAIKDDHSIRFTHSNLFAPNVSHLELMPVQQQQFQLTSKPWPLSKIVVWKRRFSWRFTLSKLHFNKQALNAWLATFQLEFSTLLSQRNSEKTFFCICTTFPTVGGLPPGVLCLLDSSGADPPMTSPTGRDPACTANRARSTATSVCCCSPSTVVCSPPHQPGGPFTVQ